MGAVLGTDPLAIVAGDGDLPKLLAEECTRTGRKHVVVLFAGFSPDWVGDRAVIFAEFEKPARNFESELNTNEASEWYLRFPEEEEEYGARACCLLRLPG